LSQQSGKWRVIWWQGDKLLASCWAASIGAEMVRLQAFALLREMEFLLWTAFPNDDSVYRLIYLGLEQISRKWKMPIKSWKAAAVTVCDPLR